MSPHRCWQGYNGHAGHLRKCPYFYVHSGLKVTFVHNCFETFLNIFPSSSFFTFRPTDWCSAVVEGVKFAFGNYCGRGEKSSRKVLASFCPSHNSDRLESGKIRSEFWIQGTFLSTYHHSYFYWGIGLMMTIIKGKTQKFKFQIGSQINLRSF